MTKALKDKITKIIKNMDCVNEEGGIEIYTDYRDRELSSSLLKEIMESKNPRIAFEDKLAEWAMDYAIDYGIKEVEEEIRKNLSEEENETFANNFDEIWEIVENETYFYYNPEDFNNEVKVNIMVDCGNRNYDYTCDNVLNYCGDGSICTESSMLWLAKAQGKDKELIKACYEVINGKQCSEENNFIKSCVQEFENLSSSRGTVTFLVKMSLFELFDLIALQNKEYDEKGKYDSRKNKKSQSYIVLEKETMCGLYDSWNGGGSVLGVELDKEVQLPIKYAVLCVEGCKMHGYDVDEVYGLTGSCWRNTIKEIKEVL